MFFFNFCFFKSGHGPRIVVVKKSKRKNQTQSFLRLNLVLESVKRYLSVFGFTRAKEVRIMADKMITLGKTNTLASRRQALSYITKEEVVKKLFDEVAPQYAERNGGYTAIYKLGPRRGDAAEMALIKLV